MKKNWYRIRFLPLALALFMAAPAGATNFILSLKSGADISQITAKYGLILVRPLTEGGQTVYLVSAPDPMPAALAGQILRDSQVRGIEQDTEVGLEEAPPPAPAAGIDLSALAAAEQNTATVNYYGSTVRDCYVHQPAATLVRVSEAQTLGAGGGVVAVIDTGIDPNHPAFQGVLAPGYDFTRDQPGYASEWADLTQSTVAILDQSTVAILDSKRYPAILNQSTVAILDQSTVAILDGTRLPSDFGHGTMVAGLVHLVAPEAQIMPLKAFHADGSANLSDIVRAIYFAVDHQAKVINMSFSSLTRYASVTAAVQYAWSHNVICVASAGNDGKPEMVYPAGDPGVIGVASTNNKDQRSAFSNYGVDSVKMAAPGEALITTYPGNNYAGVWGTSFGTALTSGAAALLAQLPAHQGTGNLSESLEHGHPVQTDGLGEGRLDVYASALQSILNRD